MGRSTVAARYPFLALCTALAILASSFGGAAFHDIGGPYGGTLTGSDDHNAPTTIQTGMTGVQVRFTDVNGDTSYDTGEPLYLLLAPADNVAAGQFRLSGSIGSVTTNSDGDLGQLLTAAGVGTFGYSLGYYDSDGNGVFNAADTAYLRTCVPSDAAELDCAATGQSVQIGWLRLTPFGTQAAGTTVASGHADHGLSATTIGIHATLTGATGAAGAAGNALNWAYSDLDGNGQFTGIDRLYWHATQAPGASSYVPLVNDVRITTGPYGSARILTEIYDEVQIRTTKTGITGLQVRFVDDNSDGGYSPGERLFLLTAPATTVPLGALRLTTSGGQLPGTHVRGSHNDYGIAIHPAGTDPDFGYGFRYHDRDGNGAPGSGDAFYLATCRASIGGAACTTQTDVRTQWVRIHTPWAAISATDADVHCPTRTEGLTGGPTGAAGAAGLDAAATTIAYWDLDGDGAYRHTDRLLWHIGRSTSATSYVGGPGDLVLAGTSGWLAPDCRPTPSIKHTISALRVDVDGTTSQAYEGRALVAWEWDFSDGNQANGATATHTFAGPGRYTISLTVRDDLGATRTGSIQVDVSSPTPTPKPTTSPPPPPNQSTDPPVPTPTGTPIDDEEILDADIEIHFDPETGDFTFVPIVPAGIAVSVHAWSIDDAEVSTNETLSHRFTEQGLHVVKLVVRAADGRTTEVIKSLRIDEEGALVDVREDAEPPVPGLLSAWVAFMRTRPWILAVAAAVLVAAGTAFWQRRYARPPPAVTTTEGNGQVTLHDIVIELGGRKVVDHVTMGLAPARLTHLLGPSGSGKSTLVKAIVGLLPFSGTIQHVEGEERTSVAGAKHAIGYVPQELQLHRDLSIRENLVYFGQQYGLDARTAKQRGLALLKELGLDLPARQRIADLSGGQARRVSIAAALLHEPKLLVLDEPTSGLDFSARKGLWVLLQDLSRRHRITILATTHFLDDTEYADHIAILDGGRLKAMGSRRELIERLPGNGKTVVIEFGDIDGTQRSIARQALEAAARAGHLRGVEHEAFASRLLTDDPIRTMSQVQVHLRNIPLRGVRLDDISIQQVFTHFTGHRFEERQ